MASLAETSTTTARRRVLVGALIFLAAAGAVRLTVRDPGLTWDEAIYLETAVRYLNWFSNLSTNSFTEASISGTWGQFDHPPLAKLWIAASIALFGGLLDLVAAARVGAGILFGVTAAGLYCWTAGRHGERAGIMAAAAFVLMPRLFAHGHFANIEMPMLFLWLLTTITFEKGVKDVRWSVVCGVLFGLALLTKMNAVFLPVILVPWGWVFHGRKVIRHSLLMVLIGGALFFAGWPVLWHHPIGATLDYLGNKIGRPLIETHYLGTTYDTAPAPWHYPFVMLIATTPLVVLAASACGVRRAVRALRERQQAAGREALVLANVAFPVLLLALPGVPKYDGVRLMLVAYPFLAVLAAWGADWACERAQRRLRGARGFGFAAAGVATLWLLAPVVAFHPYQLSYYGEMAGGPWGAKKLGLETTYWHDVFDRDALQYLNKSVPQGGCVALVGVEYRVWNIYQILGEARPDIRHSDFASGDWDYLVVVMRQGKLDAGVRDVMASHERVWEKSLPPFGTPPLCLIYRRR